MKPIAAGANDNRPLGQVIRWRVAEVAQALQLLQAAGDAFAVDGQGNFGQRFRAQARLLQDAAEQSVGVPELARLAQGPHGNPMPPPELPADAPVLDVAHPVVVNFCPAVGEEFHPALGHHGARRRNAGISQEPLFAQAWFNRHVGPFAESHVVGVRLLLLQSAQRSQLLHGDLAGLETVQPPQVRPGEIVHFRVRVHDVDLGQLMAQADLEVRLVVGGRHLQHARAELEVHVIVAEDRDELPVAWPLGGQRTHDVQTDE